MCLQRFKFTWRCHVIYLHFGHCIESGCMFTTTLRLWLTLRAAISQAASPHARCTLRA
jgi:hypothetical protein